MAVCPACGAARPQEERYCGACGGALTEPPAFTAASSPPAVLCCGLVDHGSPGSWEPEDLEFLGERFRQLADDVAASFDAAVEQEGDGTIVASFGSVWGRPGGIVQAVRAAFSLLDRVWSLRWPDGTPAQARLVVDTGTHPPSSGAGSRSEPPPLAVPAAVARMRRLVPPGAVWVIGEGQAGTKDEIHYQAPKRFTVEGIAEPVTAWRAVALKTPPRADREPVAPPPPLAGRRRELETLRAALDRVRREHRSAVVLVTGEAGIGKSRLLNEFAAAVTTATPSGQGSGVRVLRGACRRSVTFSALRELVREHAGIAVDDDAARVEAKLLAGARGADAAWSVGRLRHLVGLPAPGAPLEETVAAWRWELASMASEGCAVVIVEDAECADPSLRAVLEGLASQPLHAPLLVLVAATSSPGAAPDALVRTGARELTLAPLAPDEAEELLAGMLGQVPAGLDAVIAAAAGNALFVESYARLLLDRDLVRPGTPGATPVTLPRLETPAAVIGARLDALAPQQRALLEDAALIGHRFWRGALRALSGHEPGELDALLDHLAERRLIYRRPSTTVAGDLEFVFGHELVADAARTGLSVLDQARRQRAVASWLERVSRERADGVAEELACRWATAYESAVEAGDEDLAAEMLAPALQWLLRASQVLAAVDESAAAGHVRRALRLVPRAHPLRPEILRALGVALARSGSTEAAAVLAEALSAAQEQDRPGDAALAAASLAAHQADRLVEPTAETMALADRVVTTVERAEQVEALGLLATTRCVLGDWSEAIAAADAALAAADALRTVPPATALARRGLARCRLGDADGLEDAERGLAAQTDEAWADRAVVEAAHAEALALRDGPVSALRRSGEALSVAERRGVRSGTTALLVARVGYLVTLGEWDAALEAAARLEGPLEEADELRALIAVRLQRALVLARRGDPGAAGPAGWLEQMGSELGIQPERSLCLLGAAVVHGLGGDAPAADELVTTWVHGWNGNEPSHAALLPDAVRLVTGCSDPRWRGEPLGPVFRELPLYGLVLDTLTGLRAERAGDAGRALGLYGWLARRWRTFGAPYEQGHALLGQARCLAAAGSSAEAGAILDGAREVFTGLRARPALAEVQALHDAMPSATRHGASLS